MPAEETIWNRFVDSIGDSSAKDIILDILDEEAAKVLLDTTQEIAACALGHIDPEIPGAKQLGYEITKHFLRMAIFGLWLGANYRRTQ